MKKLIIIQNNVAGTGKTTLVRAMSRYLKHRGVTHRQIMFSAHEAEAVEPQVWVDAGAPRALPPTLIEGGPDVVLLEIGTGFEGAFLEFFRERELSDLLPTLGFETVAVIPLSRDEEGRESVVSAAETYSDSARYVLFHAKPRSPEEEGYEDTWERSYAARVMDMFEADEQLVLEAGRDLEDIFARSGTNLADTLLQENPVDAYGEDYARWLRRMDTEIHGARQSLFGEVARDFPHPTKARRVPAR